MINDKKIEEAAVKSANYLKGICDFTVINAFEEGPESNWNKVLDSIISSINKVE